MWVESKENTEKAYMGRAFDGQMTGHRYLRRIMSVLADYIAILLAEKSAMWVTALLVDSGRYERLASSYTYFWIPVIFILFYSRSNIYHMRPILDKIRDIFYCTCNGLVVSLLFL
ncbi:MAG: hypothetical protein IIW41_05520, partial [Selenomonadaceae bacterium]|nr:hypothetical protein [Selenomonadaceae bacterium]